MASITPYTTKSGKKYYKFQLYVATDELTGKRIKTTRSKFKSRKEAQLALSRLQLEIESKGGLAPKDDDTFEDIYKLWIQQYQNTVKESTLAKTMRVFKNHIIPELGAYRIEKIDLTVCQESVNKWSKKFKEYDHVCYYTSKVFEYAIDLEKIRRNPMKRVIYPKTDEIKRKKENKYYTKDELIKFLKCAEKEKNFKAYVFFRILAFSGMRKGEALALTWDDIDLKENEIYINKSLVRGLNSRLKVQSPKTENSLREILMDDKSMEILKDWQKQQKKELTMLGHKKKSSKEQLVFQNRDNEHLQLNKTCKWLNQILNKYKLRKITTHGFRHTHGTLLSESGVPLERVQERLGHGDINTTTVYVGVTDKGKKETAEQFSHYLG